MYSRNMRHCEYVDVGVGRSRGEAAGRKGRVLSRQPGTDVESKQGVTGREVSFAPTDDDWLHRI